MGALGRIVLCIFVAGLCATWPAHARAQAPAADGGGQTASVLTTVDPCVPVDPEQFQRVLSIELGTSIDYGADAPTQPGSTRVFVSCSERGIELRLEDGVTRKTMVRAIDPSRIEAGSRTRLIALAVAEFVVASWVELRIADKPALEPVGPPPDPHATQAARRTLDTRPVWIDDTEPKRANETAGTAELSGLFRLEGWSTGVGLVPSFALRLGQRPTEHLAWSIGADFGLTRAAVPPGQVQVALGSAAGTLLFVTTVGNFDLYAGGGGRFGFVRMRGIAGDQRTRGQDFFAPYGGPLIQARLAYRVTKSFRLLAEAEAGLVTLPVYGLSGRRSVLELSGAWASIGAGMGTLF